MVTLGAAAIATGLSAADGQADLVILVAVGASPRMRRWLVLSQAGTIAVLGSALGIAVGIGTSCAAMAAYNQEAATHFPVVHPFPLTVSWTSLAAALAVPLVAMLGSGLLTRSRLPIEYGR